jgi:hypothetical protein
VVISGRSPKKPFDLCFGHPFFNPVAASLADWRAGTKPEESEAAGYDDHDQREQKKAKPIHGDSLAGKACVRYPETCEADAAARPAAA